MMGILPRALAAGFMAYAILTHDCYTAMWYPEVPMDWMPFNEETICMLTILSYRALLAKDVVKRMKKAPGLQIYGKLRTSEQQRVVVEVRYEIRGQGSIFQPIYPNAEPKNFFSLFVDKNGATIDFHFSDEKYKQLREMIVDSLGHSNPEDFAELVCQKVRLKKLIQFFPAGNVLDAQRAPKFHEKSAWYQLFLQQVMRDTKHAWRNWVVKYRQFNSLTKYQSNYRAPSEEALSKYETDHPGASVKFEFEDRRKRVKNETEPEKNELVRVTSTEQQGRIKEQNNFTKVVDHAIGHKDAEIRFDPPKRNEDEVIIYGPLHSVIEQKDLREERARNIMD